MEESSSLQVNCARRNTVPPTRPKNQDAVIKPKTPLERIFGSKKHFKDHYFTDGSKVNSSNIRDIVNEQSPFKYPDDMNSFAYKLMSKRWQSTERRNELKLKYYERNSYNSRHQRDLLARLYTPIQDLKSAKTILDIDSEFYTIIQGRPIGEKFKLQKYIDNIREIMRTKIVTGYRMDDAMLIEENLIEEQNMIDEITKQYNLYVSTFEEFLSQDHGTSMALLRQSENEANKSFEKYEQYRIMAKEFGTLKSQVNNLEEKWRNCKTYQKFLYLISPIHWRKVHDHYYISDRGSTDNEESEETHSADFEHTAQPVGEVKSLEDIIQNFNEDCKNAHEPLLYFQNPKELIKVFRFIELQNLNSLLHSEELALPLENIKETMATAEANYEGQIKDLQELIDNLEGEILYEEDRAKMLEQLAKELINGEFKKLICDETTLNLYVIVEDVYETRVAANDANLSVYDMMKAVEMKYREFLLKLDYLPHDKVHKAEIECYNDQTKVMKVAVEAARKVIQIERLVKRLRRILEAPVDVHIKPLKNRSMQVRPKAAEKYVEHPISTEEAEYLHLFTDFCKEEDDIKTYRNIRKNELLIEEQVINEQEQQQAEQQ